jgi:hypothetical protein
MMNKQMTGGAAQVGYLKINAKTKTREDHIGAEISIDIQGISQEVATSIFRKIFCDVVHMEAADFEAMKYAFRVGLTAEEYTFLKRRLDTLLLKEL